MSKATLAWLETYPHRRTLWEIEPTEGFLEMVLDDFAATYHPMPSRDVIKQRLIVSLIIGLLGFSLGIALGLAIQLPH